jgi:tetratricopeptide (TPR) repeat protein
VRSVRLMCVLAALAALAPVPSASAAESAEPPAQKSIAPEAYVLYATGLQLRYAKKYDQALEAFQKALESDPGSAAIRFEIGTCYRLMGNHKKAVEVLQKALEMNPEYGPGYESLAFAYNALGQRTESLDALEKAARAKTRPRNHQNLLRRLAWIHQRAGDYNKAIEWYEYHLECGYRRRGVYLALGALYLKTARYDKALENFRHAIRRAGSETATAPQVARAYNELAADKRDAAIRHHEAAVKDDPDPEKREVLAMAYRAAGRREDMLRQLELAAEADTARAARQREFIAEYYEQLGSYAKAIEWRKRLLAEHEAPAPDALVRLANLYLKHQQVDPAIATFRKALDAAPQRNELRQRIADAYIQLQKWDEAAGALEDYLNNKDLSVKDAEVIIQLGELYHHAGKEDLADKRKKQAFDLALHAVGKREKELSDVQLHLLIAELYYADDQPHRALDYLVIARELDPDDPKKLLLITGAYQRVQKWQEAVDAFREYLKEDPGSLAAASAFLELAKCQEILGQDGRARGSRQAAIQILQNAYAATQSDKARAAVKMELGQLALRRNEPKRAVEHFLDALTHDSDNHRIHLGLAQAHHVMTDWSRAAAHYKSYVDGLDDPDDPDAAVFIYRLGLAQTRAGQTEAGRANKQKAIRILTQTLDTLKKEGRGTPAYKAALLRDLASLYSSETQYDKSIRTIQEAVDLAPPGKRTDYRLFLASVLEDREQFDKAEAILTKAHQEDPENPAVLNHLGYFYAVHDKKLDQAVQLVQKALHDEPLNGAYLDSLGWAYFKQGKLEKARDLLVKALKYEEDAVIRDHLGDVYLKLGQQEKAREAWEKALALDPDLPDLKKKLQGLKPKPKPTPEAKPNAKGKEPQKAPEPKAKAEE